MSQNAFWKQWILRDARKYGVDPQAALAVASVEGLSGGVGDGGHAFGPFQMNDAGGVLTGRPGNHRAYAESHQGVDDALSSMARAGAAGKHGAAAVEAIVTGYERPAAPGREIQNALARYGAQAGPPAGASPGLPPSPQPVQPTPTQTDNRQELARALIGQIGRETPDYGNILQLVRDRQQQQQQQPAPVQPSAPNGVPSPHPGVELSGSLNGINQGFLSQLEAAVRAAGATRIRVDSGYRSPAQNARVGGVQNSNHTYGHAVDGAGYVPGKGWVPLGVLLLGKAGRYGLRSGDVPGFYRGGRDAPHVDDAYNLHHHR